MGPEGGYGWVIVGCYVINLACVTQLVQMMGLVLKDAFKILDISDAQGAAVISTLHALSMSVGLVAGPLIRRYDFRRVAAAGALLSTAGLALTSTAGTVGEFFLFWSVMLATGIGLAYPCSVVALSTYFRARRTLAMAVALSLIGALNTLTPQLISAASATYGPRSAMLPLAGVVLQSLVAAAAMRPLRPARPASGDPQDNTKDTATEMTSKASKEGDAETPMLGADASTTGAVKIQGAEKPAVRARPAPSLLSAVVAVFDLELLRSPTFVSVLVGASTGLCSDINLTVFLPFLLAGLGFSTAQAATFLSVFSATDTVFRLAAPLLHRVLGGTSRALYAGTLVVLVGCRTALLFCRSHAAVMAMMVAIGASRGVNMVFLMVLVPDNVPLDRLPNAQGIFLMTNGIVLMAMGSIISWLLDRTKDYGVVILVLLLMNTVAMVVWSVEFVLVALRSRRQTAEATEEKGQVSNVT